MADYAWSAGGDGTLTHVKLIFKSDIGQVHEVSTPSAADISNVFIVIRYKTHPGNPLFQNLVLTIRTLPGSL